MSSNPSFYPRKSMRINNFPFLQCKDLSCSSCFEFIIKRNKDAILYFFFKKRIRDIVIKTFYIFISHLKHTTISIYSILNTNLKFN